MAVGVPKPVSASPRVPPRAWIVTPWRANAAVSPCAGLAASCAVALHPQAVRRVIAAERGRGIGPTGRRRGSSSPCERAGAKPIARRGQPRRCGRSPAWSVRRDLNGGERHSPAAAAGPTTRIPQRRCAPVEQPRLPPKRPSSPFPVVVCPRKLPQHRDSSARRPQMSSTVRAFDSPVIYLGGGLMQTVRNPLPCKEPPTSWPSPSRTFPTRTTRSSHTSMRRR